VPAGNVHYEYFKRGYMWTIPFSLSLAVWDWQFALGNLVGYSFHRYCDNDWDLMGVNQSEGRAVNELPIIGHYLFGVSSVYGSIFRRRHRKPETHWPGISTIIRLIMVFATPFVYLDAWGVNLIGNGWHLFWVGFWAGLSQADGIHFWLDLHYKD